MSEFKKLDSGKLRFSLLPISAVKEVVLVLMFGAAKYGDDNWRKVPMEELRGRYGDALLRHVFAWLDGERLDPESGLHHLAHAMCCAMFIVELEKPRT